MRIVGMFSRLILLLVCIFDHLIQNNVEHFMTLIFLMLSNFFSLSIFPKTSLSFLTIQHQMITKSNLLIINEERDSVLFTKE